MIARLGPWPWWVWVSVWAVLTALVWGVFAGAERMRHRHRGWGR